MHRTLGAYYSAGEVFTGATQWTVKNVTTIASRNFASPTGTPIAQDRYELERTNNGAGVYEFDMSLDTLDVIMAIGRSKSFNGHGNDGRIVGTLQAI